MHELPFGVQYATLCLNQSPSIVLVTTIKHWTGLVVDASHLERLMNLFTHVIIRKVFWPVVTHLDGLVCARVSHLEVSLLHVLLSQLL